MAKMNIKDYLRQQALISFPNEFWERLNITGLSHNSRHVKAGDLFIAVPSVDAAKGFSPQYGEEALAHGAVGIVAPSDVARRFQRVQAPVFPVDNIRTVLAGLAGNFFSSQPSVIAAVTGTNGKTSVCWIVKHIWQTLGYHSAALGSLGLQASGQEKIYPYSNSFMNTPDPIALHSCLSELALQGVNHLVMEATSHGLDQQRIDQVKISVAAFTNLSQEHLDYHGSMEAYYHAKKRLFIDLLPQTGVAVLNADEDHWNDLTALCASRGVRVISYGSSKGDIRLVKARALPTGQALELSIFGQSANIHFPLVGAFQAMNALCALGIVLAHEDGEAAQAVTALASLTPVRGRMQRVGETHAGAHVFVDYAHKPQALQVVLETLRAHCAANLTVVFGCGGDRDPGRRSLMGRVAEGYADKVYITDDNPRTEDPQKIRQAIAEACPKGIIIPDRKCAIEKAIGESQGGDIILIAGKGHETHQIIGAMACPFNDAEIAQAAIEAL